MAKKAKASDHALQQLRAYGLAYPGAHTKSPWPGHLDLAVNDKTFAYLSVDGEPFSISCKLPNSSSIALMMPDTAPTPYGLGKSGWVSFTPKGDIPVELLKSWIDESYRAQAPKKLIKQIDADPAPVTEKAARPSKKAPARLQRTPRAGAKRKAAASGRG